jgi:hypothetical protein
VFEVVGGPYDGRRVRELLTVGDGSWVMDRYWLCRPEGRRGTPRQSYPYALRDGKYVWTEESERKTTCG